MDPTIAYEMRVRFRQDMAAAFGEEWKPGRLPPLEPVVAYASRPRRNAQTDLRERRARAIAMRREGKSFEEVCRAVDFSDHQLWALLARWAPEPLDREAA